MSQSTARRYALTAALAVLVAGTVMPWARSGARSRNSYSLFSVADRIGVLSGSAATAARWWFVVPAVAIGAAAVLQFGYHRVGAITAIVVATVSLIAVNKVADAPLERQRGLAWTSGAAVIVLLLGVPELLLSFRRSTSRPTPGVSRG